MATASATASKSRRGVIPGIRSSVPTALLYGINALRNELLVLNPDTGQAFVLGASTGDPNLAMGRRAALRYRVVAGRPHAVCAGLRVRSAAPRRTVCYTLDPDTGAILTTVVVTVDRPLARVSQSDRPGGRRQRGVAGRGEFCPSQ